MLPWPEVPSKFVNAQCGDVTSDLHRFWNYFGTNSKPWDPRAGCLRFVAGYAGDQQHRYTADNVFEN